MLARWPVRPGGKVEKKECWEGNHVTLTAGLFLPSFNSICKVIPLGLSVLVCQSGKRPSHGTKQVKELGNLSAPDKPGTVM